MIKSVSEINYYGKRIGTTCKDNSTSVCPACNENEDWEHVVLCENNKNNREEREKALEIKIKT